MKKNNVRFLTTTLAAATLLTSTSSYGLGIGEMKLKSALNQKLQAEISLILAEGENVSDFNVNLATNEKFDKAGIPWTLFLSKIKFKIVPRNGKAVIELSSNEVLKEPFLDFLIEVKSAKGNLYREFTALIDPPADYQASKPVVAPVASSNPVITTPINAPVSSHSSSEPLRFVEPQVNQTSETYLTRGETLWNIAAKYNKQNNVSVNRMVAAIFIANPEAFKTNNPHSLLPNKLLKIPSFSEAPETFIVSKKFAPKRTTVKKSVKKVAELAKGKVAVKTDEHSLASAEPKKPELTKKVADKKLSDEKLSDDSKQRLAELEKQLATMQKTIADKEVEMNALKSAKKTAPQVAVTPVPTVSAPVEKPIAIPSVVTPAPVVPATTETPVAISPVTIPTPSVPAVVETPIAIPPATPTPAVPTAVETPVTIPPVAIPTPAVPVAIGTPVTIPPVVTPAPVVPAPVADNYFGISQEFYYYIAGGVGSLLLSILGLLRLREQRKNKKEGEVETLVVESEMTESGKSEVAVADTAQKSDSMDAMFGDDESFDMSSIDDSFFDDASAGFADFASNESTQRRSMDDVLYKVDVYCTYGSHKEAETLLKTEFFNKPDKHEYALRLLKLYQDQDEKHEFKEFVLELAKLGKNDVPDFWSQVSDIAAEFYPEALFFTHLPAIPDENAISTNEMFADLNTDTKSEDDVDFDSMSFDDVDEKEITFGELTVEESIGSVKVDDIFNNESLEFSFETPETKTEEKLEFGGFSLGDSFDFDFTKNEPEVEELMMKNEQTLDFNFDNFALEETAKTEVSEELDFGGFALDEPAKTDISEELDFGSFALEEPVKTEVADELDFGGFALEEPAKTDISEELDFSDFALEEPVKIDVADELDFGSFALEEPVKTEVSEELDFSGFALEEPVKTEVSEELDFSGFALEEPVKTEISEELDFSGFALEEPVKTEVADELDFSGFSLEEPMKTEVTEELDFSGFALAEPMKTEVADELDFSGFALEESVKTEVADELDFSDFALEKPVKIEVADELDFGGFALEESVKTEVADELDFSDFALEKPVKIEVAEELDFGGFIIPEEHSKENNPLEDGLDLGSFVVLESVEKTFHEKLQENESALDLAIKNFKIDDSEEFTPTVEMSKSTEPESITTTEKLFAKSAVEKPLDFGVVNELVKKRINETHLELANVHVKEEAYVAYLDMSDAQFAASIAEEVLKKCQIREQLCRQKITQEVLTKLS